MKNDVETDCLNNDGLKNYLKKHNITNIDEEEK